MLGLPEFRFSCIRNKGCEKIELSCVFLAGVKDQVNRCIEC